MTIITVKTRINDWLTPRWATLVTKQDQYFAANGRYFQGLWSHTGETEQTDALDGDSLADSLASKPTDQTHDWRDFIGNALDAVPFPCRLRLDVYDGSQGYGWQAVLEVLYKGDIYVRTQQVGPETYRTHGWLKR